MHVASCSSCSKPIIWVTSPTGARLPVSARPVAVYTLDEDDPPNAVKVIREEKLYISHFIDCPNATQHSKSATGRPREQL